MLSFLAAAATVSAYNVSTSTEVVSAYTTYCPQPTTFTEGSRTYTVTEPTTLTISDCPCTRTHTFSTETVTVCPSSSTPSVAVQPNTGNSTTPAFANGAAKQGLSVAAALGAVVIGGLL